MFFTFFLLSLSLLSLRVLTCLSFSNQPTLKSPPWHDGLTRSRKLSVERFVKQICWWISVEDKSIINLPMNMMIVVLGFNARWVLLQRFNERPERVWGVEPSKQTTLRVLDKTSCSSLSANKILKDLELKLFLRHLEFF